MRPIGAGWIACGFLAIAPGFAQPAAKFEVASIKLCSDTDRSTTGDSSPGRLTVNCRTVRSLIQQAYDLYATGKADPANPMIPRLPIEGGPAWIDTDRYSIEAKTETPQEQAMMRGPMVQALLEDRFRLKLHRATREAPVYALTVAKGGLKLPRTVDGSCTPFVAATPAPAGKPWCVFSRSVRKGPNVTWEANGLSLDAFSQALGLDRPVIDQTGVAGIFDFHLEFSPEGGDPDDTARGPSIFTVLERLGLKLEPAKGPCAFLIIDSVERPSRN